MSARTKCTCLLVTGAALLFAAQTTVAQPICPMPVTPILWCEQLQPSQCLSANPATELCLPRVVINQPGALPFIEACDCFDDQGCGPVSIDQGGVGEWIYSCQGGCPVPGEQCEVFVDGNPSGQISVSSLNLPADAQVTCDCFADEPEVCPLSGDQLCANLQMTDCQTTDPTTTCYPAALRIVDPGAIPVQVVADVCACFDGQDCGPIQVDPIGTDYALSCTGACPPLTGPCEIFVDGLPSGMQNGNASQFPRDSVLTCDCPDVAPEVCPLSSDQLCANLQQTDCADGIATDVCTPTTIMVTSGPPNVGVVAEVCDCADFTSCGPVQVDPIGMPPTDYAFSCTGACPPGQPGPCLVFVDGVSTGVANINASALPVGSLVTCDCEPPVELCPLATDYCTNLQLTDCITTNALSTLCWPRAVAGGTPSFPDVLACDCFEDECGPVQIDDEPTGQGFIYSCPGPCPDLSDPCEIFFDDGTGPVSTGQNSVRSVDVPADVIVTCDCGEGEPAPVIIEWSMDIGGDTELSDPNFDGDEGGDPGDVYLWRGPPYRPPAEPFGRDGFKDDMFIFGNDPWPDPPDFAFPPMTAVPVGASGDPNDEYARFFDLDGHDQIDFNIEQFVPPTAPLEFPIPQDAIALFACVHNPEFLLFSYDDDMAPGWLAPFGDVPVTAPSPAGLTYGTSGGNDEIVGKTLAPALALPLLTVVDYRAFDEIDIHTDMAPNPDLAEPDDDDVDSLDAVRDPADCPFWYFSADHEAHFGLDPGSIYLATGFGPPMQVIDDVIHLGLPESTDVDAFEFTWLPADLAGGVVGPALAVLFSVDEDDPLTLLPADESGGLDPAMIYGSFLTGFSFPVLLDSEKPTDDVDALTIWIAELLPTCANTDVNCDGNTNAGDIGLVANPLNFQQSPPACDRTDVNGDGNTNAGDIGVIANPLNFQQNPTGPCDCTTATPIACGVP